MALVIDRFEGDIAVCQDQDTEVNVNLAISALPPEAAEGDMLIYQDGKYIIDQVETLRRKKKIQNLMKSLWAADEMQEEDNK